VTSRSEQGRRDRVEAARRQARLALGKDPTSENDYSGQQKTEETPAISAAPPATHDGAVLVLTLGEAAARLGVTREALEAMIAAGKIQALPTGFTRMIPSAEIDRLQKSNQ
jgi:excisionase family DNA binding protein